MKKTYFISILILVASGVKNLIAQESAVYLKQKNNISIEELIGNKRQVSQLLVNSVFTERKKIGLLSITSYAANYSDDLGANEFQNTALIYHQLFKGFGINSGTSFTTVEGLRNSSGIQYMCQNKSLSLILMSSYFYTKSNKISNLAILEYKPVITTKWAYYIRLQLHYNYNLANGTHFRSYVYSRLGLTYNYFSFGLAHNYDCYGPSKRTKNNYGVFLKLTI